MKKILSCLLFINTLSLNAEWSEVKFISSDKFSVNFEKYNTPLIFEWGELVGFNREGVEDWGYLFKLKNARHMIKSGILKEQFFEDFLYRFEDGYYSEKIDQIKTKFFETAQTITQEEYEKKYPFFRFTSVYGKIGIRDGNSKEWAFLLIQNSADEYMTHFPLSFLGSEPEGASAIFLSRNNDGRYVISDITNPDVPVFVRNMEIRYLNQVSQMIKTGYSYFPKDSISIKSLNPMAVWDEMRSD